jgi:hypothetical protein
MKKRVNGVEVQMTDAEIAEVQAQWAEEDAKKAATQYKTDRMYAYPPLAEQLDYIYHNGVEAWKTDIIDPIKTRYPKP